MTPLQTAYLEELKRDAKIVFALRATMWEPKDWATHVSAVLTSNMLSTPWLVK